MSVKLFKKFNEIDKNYICTDKHIHTRYVDGEGTISEITKHAEALGLHQIAFTEHIRKESSYFRSYIKEIQKIRKKSVIQILAGFEAKINSFEGDIDVVSSVAAKAQVMIASVHRFPFRKKLYNPDDFKKDQCQAIELELSMVALKKSRFDVLGHPGGMSLHYFAEFPVSFFEEIIIGCRRNGIAFELNSKYHRLVLKRLLPLLKKHNPVVSLGSDAHNIKDIENSTDFLRDTI